MATKKKLPIIVTATVTKEIEPIAINYQKPLERKDMKTSAERLAYDEMMFPEKHRFHK